MIVPRFDLSAMAEAEHGGGIARLEHEQPILDFSASINPFGPPPGVAAAIGRARVDRYPDRDATEFRTAVGAFLDVSVDRLIAGNGSTELLYLVALGYLRPGDLVLAIGPTYSEYARVSHLMGANVLQCDASIDTQFSVPVDEIEFLLNTRQPRAVFLCNPNNPTGQAVSTAVCERWFATFSDTLFVIDEAYIEFAQGVASLVRTPGDNVVVIRSMTKAFGLAGLRLGYAVADPQIILTLCRIRPPWSVSSPAQAAGLAAIAGADYVERSIQILVDEKAKLYRSLQHSGWTVYPSLTHFFLLDSGKRIDLLTSLQEKRIRIRKCDSFGHSNLVRISAQRPTENSVLCDVLKTLMWKVAIR